MTRKDRIDRRNKKIRKRFDVLRNVKKNGVRLYTSEAIFTMMDGEFDLAPETIEKIVVKTK